MKKLLIAMFMVLFVGSLAACTLNDSKASESYLLVEINPKIEFTLDEEEKVISINLLNEDAEIVAADLDLIGLSYEEALDLFLEAALEAGYIDVSSEDNAIFVTLYSDDEEYEGDLNERVRGRAEEFMVRERIQGGVFGGELLREDIKAIADEYDVRFNQARAAYAVSEAFEDITLEEAIEMEFQELMQLLRTNHQERMQAFGQEMRERANAIREGLNAENRERLEEHRANHDNIPEDMIRERMTNMHGQVSERIDEMREAHEARSRARRDEVTNDDDTEE